MASTLGKERSLTVEIGHHYVGGDGAAAFSSLAEGFRRRNQSVNLQETQYDNLRLQVKSRILKQDPPDAWTGWPGGEMAGYVEANTVRDITDFWTEGDLDRQIRPFIKDTCMVGDSYHAVPISTHRVNDLYVHVETAEELGVDPATASDPAELVEVLSQVDDDDVASVLVPMADPFVVLQLWELTLLGLYDHATFRSVTAGNATANRDAIRSALETVADLAALAPDASLYHSMPDGNDMFVDGEALAYPQGDWAGGVFVETDGFEYRTDWERAAFPGTENMYDIVLDSIIPSETADGEAVETFLEYAGSTEAQESFNRLKGSIPPRKDVSTSGFSEFARAQEQSLDRSTEQPQSITHGLSTSTAQLVDLKSVIAEFVDTWDAQQATREMVEIFDER